MNVAIWIAPLALVCGGCSTVTTEPPARRWPALLQTCAVAGLAAPALCGSVTVAESTEDPRGRQLSIRVIVVPASAGTPAPDPVVMLAGGPGQGAADLAAALTPRTATVREHRDLVLIDQRGTGQSNALHCPPPESAAALMGHIFDPARLTACRDGLASRADLTRYTTSAAAADYGAVFEALGYRHVNIWGVSYGTRLGLELARRFPDRVRTLTLEGVVPTSFTWPSEGATDAEAALNAIINDCAADADCARAFPRMHRDVDAAFATLRRQPASVRVRDPATGAWQQVMFGVTDLAYSTRGLLYGNDALALPRLFHDAADGRYDAFAQFYVNRARNLDRQLARGVHLGVYCAEDLPFVDWQVARARAAGTRIDSYLLDQYEQACKVWPAAAVPALFREPVQSSVPTLLLSGRRDPVTPPRTAEDVARMLSRSRVLIWRYGGHGAEGLSTVGCRTGIIGQFIASGDPNQISADCITQDAILPFQVSSAGRR